MEFKIGEPTKTPENPKDAFLITCTAMFGDADGYEEVKMALIPNTPEYLPYLQEGVEFCERMAAYNPYKIGRDKSFKGIEGGDKWLNFYGPAYNDAEIPEIYLDITQCNEREGWPTDPMTDYTIEASFRGYKVRYFDENGVEHDVEVIK